jgi:hypothetical protein
MTLAACVARVSVCTSVVGGTVGGVSSGRVDVEVDEVLLLVAVACVCVGWVVLVCSI